MYHGRKNIGRIYSFVCSIKIQRLPSISYLPSGSFKATAFSLYSGLLYQSFSDSCFRLLCHRQTPPNALCFLRLPASRSASTDLHRNGNIAVLVIFVRGWPPIDVDLNSERRLKLVRSPCQLDGCCTVQESRFAIIGKRKVSRGKRWSKIALITTSISSLSIYPFSSPSLHGVSFSVFSSASSGLPFSSSLASLLRPRQNASSNRCQNAPIILASMASRLRW